MRTLQEKIDLFRRSDLYPVVSSEFCGGRDVCEVVAAIDKLFENLRAYPIPLNMLHQYMPLSYNKIRTGALKLDPKELAMDGVTQYMLDYEYAV